MLKYRAFHEKYITGVCRNCLIQNSGLRLMSDDCAHSPRECRCPQCGEYRFPIIGLKTFGRLRVLFFKDENT